MLMLTLTLTLTLTRKSSVTDVLRCVNDGQGVMYDASEALGLTSLDSHRRRPARLPNLIPPIREPSVGVLPRHLRAAATDVRFHYDAWLLLSRYDVICYGTLAGHCIARHHWSGNLLRHGRRVAVTA